MSEEWLWHPPPAPRPPTANSNLQSWHHPLLPQGFVAVSAEVRWGAGGCGARLGGQAGDLEKDTSFLRGLFQSWGLRMGWGGDGKGGFSPGPVLTSLPPTWPSPQAGRDLRPKDRQALRRARSRGSPAPTPALCWAGPGLRVRLSAAGGSEPRLSGGVGGGCGRGEQALGCPGVFASFGLFSWAWQGAVAVSSTTPSARAISGGQESPQGTQPGRLPTAGRSPGGPVGERDWAPALCHLPALRP